MIGNIHSAEAPRRDGMPAPAASYVPDALTFDPAQGEGEIWACRGMSPEDCSAGLYRTAEPFTEDDDWAITLSDDYAPYADGAYQTPALTASRPAALTEPCGECELLEMQ